MRRGQAALEFLMTYSWAILVVIIIIGALAYFGVLNPQSLMPDKCTLTAGFSCDDYLLQGGGSPQVSFTVTNGLGRSIELTYLNITSPAGNECKKDLTVTVAPGDRYTFTASASESEVSDCVDDLQGLEGSKTRVKIKFGWKYADMGDDAAVHTAAGEIFARVEG